MSNLGEIIERYGTNKAELDKIKKVVDADNTEIKLLMNKDGLSEFSSDNFTAKCSVITSQDFDEGLLLAKIKELGLSNCIATREYVDMEVLENLIYNGSVNAAELASCKVTKSQTRLTIKKNK